MFHGLSAFPLTPLHNNQVDQHAFSVLMERLVQANVDSIGVLGSTGCYPYLSEKQRQQVTQLAVDMAGGIPVMAGIGATNLYDVLTHCEQAQHAGATALMLAPVSYHVLNDDEVYALFETVSRQVSVPICVYNNTGTTHFSFSDELYIKIAQLPNIGAIKMPAISKDIPQAKQRLASLREQLPKHIKLGASTDSLAAYSIASGMDVWFSATAGLLPEKMQEIAIAAQAGNLDIAITLSEQYSPLWECVARNKGSVRCVAAIAEILKLVDSPCLPSPLNSAQGADREILVSLVNELKLS
ncbi:TPA: dihydrodipicolinate synthase family protein [Providencia alcalifaciens]|nr:dihydrodipicolinate synthase family protein [Providencia alcalifaciens]